MMSSDELKKLNLTLPLESELRHSTPAELIKLFYKFSCGGENESFLNQNYIWILLSERHQYPVELLRDLFGDELDKWSQREDVLSAKQRVARAASILSKRD